MQKNFFSKKLIAVISGITACLFLCGCFYVVLGGIAAVGGYAVSQDTIQGETEKGFDSVWYTAVNTLSIMGLNNSQSRELGKITAVINGAKVTVNVMQLTPSTIRLKVKARKSLFPSITNAQNIYIKIMNRVKE